MKKQPEKTKKTKESIINSFWELYKTTHISKITVKNITDGAGVFRSTFYLYFTDVYAILEDIENKIITDWEIMFTKIIDEGHQELALDMITDFYEQDGEYLSILFDHNGDPAFQKKIKDIMRPKMFLMFGIDDSNLKMHLAFEFIISAMFGYLTAWYKNSDKFSAKEAVELLRTLTSSNIPCITSKYFNSND